MTTDVVLNKIVDETVTPPKLWRVIFINDDVTPMDFVIALLKSVFKHNEHNAQELTLEIHNTGSAIVGVYTHEIAEQKGIEATQISRNHGHPLQIKIEQE